MSMIATAERPTDLADVVGQTEAISRLRIVFEGAKLREVKPPHVLLSGPAGHGKTTLARIVAVELASELVTTSGPVLRRPGDLAGLLAALAPNGVLFIDEIHALPTVVEEALYEALEDGKLSIMIGAGEAARAVTVPLPPFVCVGATTRPGSLSTPLRDRFGLHLTMAPYTDEELSQIVRNYWRKIGSAFEDGAAEVVGKAAKGVPRLALHLAARVLDVAAIRKAGVSASLARSALEAFGVDREGLDELDMRILRTLVVTFGGRAVGLDALAQCLDIDARTLTDEHEGPLVRAGYMVRTRSGRMATPDAHELVRSAA